MNTLGGGSAAAYVTIVAWRGLAATGSFSLEYLVLYFPVPIGALQRSSTVWAVRHAKLSIFVCSVLLLGRARRLLCPK